MLMFYIMLFVSGCLFSESLCVEDEWCYDGKCSGFFFVLTNYKDVQKGDRMRQQPYKLVTLKDYRKKSIFMCT